MGAVVNATFGSITELTFYITALIKGSREGNRCYAEVVKSALTGTLVGCVLFVPVRWGGTHSWEGAVRRELMGDYFFVGFFFLHPHPKGLCMVIGGIRHQEQRFNSRSAGVSSALLFLSVGGELGTLGDTLGGSQQGGGLLQVLLSLQVSLPRRSSPRCTGSWCAASATTSPRTRWATTSATTVTSTW